MYQSQVDQLKKAIEDNNLVKIKTFSKAALKASLDNHGRTAFQVACLLANVETIRCVGEQLGSDALGEACRENTETCNALHAVLLNKKLGNNKSAALNYVINIIGRGAKPFAIVRNRLNQSALQVACGHATETEIATIIRILDNTAKNVALEVTVDGWTPMHAVCRYNPSESCVRLLLNLYGDNAAAVCSRINNDGWTPLHFICDNHFVYSEPVVLVANAIGKDIHRVAAIQLPKSGRDAYGCLESNKHTQINTTQLREIFNRAESTVLARERALAEQQAEIETKRRLALEAQQQEEEAQEREWQEVRESTQRLQQQSSARLQEWESQWLADREEKLKNQIRDSITKNEKKYISDLITQRIAVIKKSYQNREIDANKCFKLLSELLDIYYDESETILFARAEFLQFHAQESDSIPLKIKYLQFALNDYQAILSINFNSIAAMSNVSLIENQLKELESLECLEEIPRSPALRAAFK